MTNSETLLPEQAFIARYGVEPNRLTRETVAHNLFTAMDAFSVALYYRSLESRSERTARLGVTGARPMTREAMVYLYIDGPVDGFPADYGHDILNAKGEKAKELAEHILTDPIHEVTQEIREKFGEVIDLLSATSGQDLSWLKQFIGKSRKDILEEVGLRRVSLTPEQLAFLENKGFMTWEEWRAAQKEAKA